MLSRDEIDTIKEQELTRLQLRRELSPEKKSKAWEFLNSQFFLWFIGSVVLGLFTYYWNHRSDERLDKKKELESYINMKGRLTIPGSTHSVPDQCRP